ncbi:hypothetical protein E5Q_02673 [Mixia osmundae IAM 14324]|uniref:Uncharacterized protein n=1 Tax=Mixia osmundae (strain CBS 9802 / IAM 14324 / JCM 22182 / KY 12970) TaxID=764103 RepID=G7DZK3_MIXOS|nr:hypothetical protein E5Q_02673 [Mixia osmundae IAM 14324]
MPFKPNWTVMASAIKAWSRQVKSSIVIARQAAHVNAQPIRSVQRGIFEGVTQLFVQYPQLVRELPARVTTKAATRWRPPQLTSSALRSSRPAARSSAWPSGHARVQTLGLQSARSFSSTGYTFAQQHAFLADHLAQNIPLGFRLLGLEAEDRMHSSKGIAHPSVSRKRRATGATTATNVKRPVKQISAPARATGALSARLILPLYAEMPADLLQALESADTPLASYAPHLSFSSQESLYSALRQHENQQRLHQIRLEQVLTRLSAAGCFAGSNTSLMRATGGQGVVSQVMEWQGRTQLVIEFEARRWSVLDVRQALGLYNTKGDSLDIFDSGRSYYEVELERELARREAETVSWYELEPEPQWSFFGTALAEAAANDSDGDSDVSFFHLEPRSPISSPQLTLSPLSDSPRSLSGLSSLAASPQPSVSRRSVRWADEAAQDQVVSSFMLPAPATSPPVFSAQHLDRHASGSDGSVQDFIDLLDAMPRPRRR